MPSTMRPVSSALVHAAFTSGTNQAVDWGKNKRNQQAFFRKLGEVLRSRAGE